MKHRLSNKMTYRSIINNRISNINPEKHFYILKETIATILCKYLNTKTGKLIDSNFLSIAFHHYNNLALHRYESPRSQYIATELVEYLLTFSTCVNFKS